MKKSGLSYFLLVCAAIVAFIYINDYLDRITDTNFTTPTITVVRDKEETMVDDGDIYTVEELLERKAQGLE